MNASVLSSSETIEASKIDWLALKAEDYSKWRHTLFTVTLVALQELAREDRGLDELNKHGLFHKTLKAYGDSMRREIEGNSQVPRRWIYKGHFAGIWCTLFDPKNTYSMSSGDDVFFKFSFKSEFRIFDPFNELHQKMWQAWKSVEGNLAKQNIWESDVNDRGVSLKDRMSFVKDMPNHSAFYSENRFGAIVGYSDYMACVIIDEKAIESVQALEGVYERRASRAV